MRINKIAQSVTKERLDGKYGPYNAYMIQGTRPETYPIKDSLKAMGFSWNKYLSKWYMSEKNFDSNRESLMSRLNSIGVSTTSISGPSQQPVSQGEQTSADITPPQQSKEPNRWVTENPEMTSWYGFPINDNILSWDRQIERDGVPYAVHISIDRTYQPGKQSTSYRETKSREDKLKPIYRINVSVPDLDIDNHQRMRPKNKIWGQYSEDEFLKELKDAVDKNFIDKEDSKTNQTISLWHDISKREEEYREFLDRIGNKEESPEFNIKIDDPEYGGDYKIGVNPILVDRKSNSVDLVTKLGDPSAPYPKSVGGYRVFDILGTYTIQDFYNKINSEIQGNEKVKSDYIEYLKSFPYLESQKKEAHGDFNEISQIVNRGSADSDFILRKLQEKGYIRPHKRQKQGLGLTMGDEIRWVVDSKKIVNDAYSGGYLTQTPDYFYTVVAYCIHRLVRDIQSWTDMMLTDSVRRWYMTMERMGASFDFRDIYRTIEDISKVIVSKIKGKTDSSETGGTSRNSPYDLSEFVSFAEKHGISTEDIETNAKNIYRALSKALHPDLYQDPDEKIKMEEEFKELQRVWGGVPEIYKKADNWYDFYKESAISEDNRWYKGASR